MEVMKRLPRVLYFVDGMVPSAEDREAIKQYGPKAAFRNAQMVSNVPTSPLEECDFVAGPAIPARYANTYPTWRDGMEQAEALAVLNRASDLDLPHATLTGEPVTTASNEAARAAKPPSVNDFVSPTNPRERGAMTAPHGGTAIPRPAGNTLAAFGAERAENRTKPGEAGDTPTGTAAPEDGQGTDGKPVGTNAAPTVAPKFGAAASGQGEAGDDAAKAEAAKAAEAAAKAAEKDKAKTGNK